MTDRFAGEEFEGSRHKGKRLGTLWISHCKESGDVTLSHIFDEMDNLMKLDVLGDCIGLLQREYIKSLEETHSK